MRGSLSMHCMAAVVAGLLTLAAGGEARAQAAPAAPDTSFQSYLASLADSSRAVFGSDTLEFDTTGVDSLGRFYTEHPELAPRTPRDFDPRAQGSENAPVTRLSRAEGQFAGARLQLNGIERGPGALSLEGGYSFGQKQGRYAMGFTRAVRTDDLAFSAHLSAYRSTDHLDALQAEPDPIFRSPRLVDRPTSVKFRRDGWRARALLQRRLFSLEGTWRDEQAHTMGYPGGFDYYLLGGTPDSRRAVPGTVRALAGSVALGASPEDGMFKARYEHAGFGGKFEFNRVRVDLGRTFRVGSSVLFGFQAEWSAADSGAPAQELSYAGGGHGLQGYDVGAIQARQLYLGRAVALIGPDILQTLRIPHPSLLTLSLALFAEVGAAPVLKGGDGIRPQKPAGGDWVSDVGIGLWHGPGIIDPNAYLKLSAAVPVGPRSDHKVKWAFTWTRMLDWF